MQEWERVLVQAGCRLTAARRAVIQVLAATTAPLPPGVIRQRASGIYPRLGLVTVYRTLDLLERFALVRRVHQENGCHGYLPASPGHQHAILCRTCGQATEFSGSEDLDGLMTRVERDTGYRVEEHLLQLVGLCPTCQGGRV